MPRASSSKTTKRQQVFDKFKELIFSDDGSNSNICDRWMPDEEIAHLITISDDGSSSSTSTSCAYGDFNAAISSKCVFVNDRHRFPTTKTSLLMHKIKKVKSKTRRHTVAFYYVCTTTTTTKTTAIDRPKEWAKIYNDFLWKNAVPRAAAAAADEQTSRPTTS